MAKRDRTKWFASAKDRLRAEGNLVGVHSKKAVSLGCGTSIWLGDDDREVEVTAVYATAAQARSHEPWSDLAVVGRVVKLLRAGRPELASYDPEDGV